MNTSTANQSQGNQGNQGGQGNKDKGQHLKEVPLMDKATDAIEQGKQAFQDVVSGAGPLVQDAYRFAEEGVRGALDTTSTFIRKNPVPTILAGFGVGCLVGLMLRRHE